MPDLRLTPLKSMKRVQPDLPPSAQAVLTIPMGTVYHMRQIFEERISNHHDESVDTLIAKALQNMQQLMRQKRTYIDQLRLIETIGLRDLAPHLRAFIRDHDNMHRAVIRSRLSAMAIQADSTVDVGARILSRIEDLSRVFWLRIIVSTGADAPLMKKNTAILAELSDCTDALVDELCRLLPRHTEIIKLLQSDDRLENVGPDHDVNDFGSDVVLTTQAPKVLDQDALNMGERCCICLDTYTYTSSSHPPFRLSACVHILGKPCLASWLNSTSTNSNQCPICRATLCTRRPRQVSAQTTLLQREFDALERAANLALHALEYIDGLANRICGDGDKGTVGVWAADAMRAMNGVWEAGGVELVWMVVDQDQDGEGEWVLMCGGWAVEGVYGVGASRG